MTRFQDLLKPDSESTPDLIQERASLYLPDVVRQSQLSWWSRRHEDPTESGFLLLVVAPYSHYDLAMLDILDEEIKSRGIFGNPRHLPVYVANILQYPSIDHLKADISVITGIPSQTPVSALWEDGGWLDHASGKGGRDLAAGIIGLDPREFNDRVIARVPRYAPSA